MPKFPVFLTSILRERKVAAGFLGFGVFLVCTNLLGLRLWRCAMLEATGLPCPGCGMTRAMSALCRGDLALSWALHPFACGFLAFAIMLVLALVLPARARQAWLRVMEKLERCTGFSLLFLVAMTLWGLARTGHAYLYPLEYQRSVLAPPLTPHHPPSPLR